MTGTGRAPPNVSAFRVLVSQVLLPVKSYKEESYEENICFIAKNDLNKNAFSSGICRNISISGLNRGCHVSPAETVRLSN